MNSSPLESPTLWFHTHRWVSPESGITEVVIISRFFLSFLLFLLVGTLVKKRKEKKKYLPFLTLFKII